MELANQARLPDAAGEKAGSEAFWRLHFEYSTEDTDAAAAHRDDCRRLGLPVQLDASGGVARRRVTTAVLAASDKNGTEADLEPYGQRDERITERNDQIMQEGLAVRLVEAARRLALDKGVRATALATPEGISRSQYQRNLDFTKGPEADGGTIVGTLFGDVIEAAERWRIWKNA